MRCGRWRTACGRARSRSSSASSICSAPGKPLGASIAAGQLHSLILWGPPGTGKTTLARLIAQRRERAVHRALGRAWPASRTSARRWSRRAQAAPPTGRPTLLFLDEVHRFNKAQQDAFLPYLEDGTLTFIGATTENPSFEVVSALLSRARVYVLQALDRGGSQPRCCARALARRASAGSGASSCRPRPERSSFSRARPTAMRGARSTCSSWPPALARGERRRRTRSAWQMAQEVASGGQRRFDKGGDQFYDQISALHKAVRGTDPDAALYWLCRMLDGGCDPLYLARRIVRMAIEDIGLADPRALALALDAWQAYERLGTPEGRAGARRRRWCISPARPRATRCTWPWGRRCADVEKLRHARSAAAAAQCADPPDEGSRLRPRLPLRAR